MTVKLSPEQKQVYHYLDQTDNNVFVTGKAGTGKSILLQYFVEHTHKKVAVVAPTGAAALNVGGQTIHSMFGLGLHVQDIRDDARVGRIGARRRQLLKQIETLVIDEISMVSVDVMDMIDAKLKNIHRNNKPFGGCQVVVFGDLYQLPPVIPRGQALQFLRDRYNTLRFFGIKSIQENPFTIIELQHVFRQEDKQFIELLNKIRLGDCNFKILDQINQCYKLPPEKTEFITLTGDNATANSINRRKLAELNTPEYVFEGEIDGGMAQSTLPTEQKLHLRKGAHVMLLKNDTTSGTDQPRWVNGTLGVIAKLNKKSIKVKIGKKIHKIEPVKWEKIQYDYNDETQELTKEVVATFKQYPLRLAWAITIHKSQGQTYDAVHIDLSRGAFATGQTYVALSRCRSMDTLSLEQEINLRDIRVDPEIAKYMKNIKTVDDLPAFQQSLLD